MFALAVGGFEASHDRTPQQHTAPGLAPERS